MRASAMLRGRGTKLSRARSDGRDYSTDVHAQRAEALAWAVVLTLVAVVSTIALVVQR